MNNTARSMMVIGAAVLVLVVAIAIAASPAPTVVGNGGVLTDIPPSNRPGEDMYCPAPDECGPANLPAGPASEAP